MRMPCPPLTAHVRFVLAGVVALLLALAGCERSAPQPVASTPSNAAPIERRIVVLSPALAVMLQQLGHEDDIVAKHTWDLALGDAIPTIGDQFELDYETLLRLDPTHVPLHGATGGGLGDANETLTTLS